MVAYRRVRASEKRLQLKGKEMPDRKVRKLVKRRFGNANGFSFKEITRALICFLTCGALFTGLTLRYVKTSVDLRRYRLEFFVASAYANEIHKTLEHTLSAAYTAAELVYSGMTAPDTFGDAVQRLLPHYPSVLNVELAPAGIITQIEPTAGNEAAIGLNLFEYDKCKAEANAAERNGKISLIGPYVLMQGFPGLIGMLPVFTQSAEQEKRFWGFVNVVMDADSMVTNLRESDLYAKGYSYELLKTADGEDGYTTVARTETAVKNPVESAFEIANTKWIFKIEPVGGWLNVRGIVRLVIILFITDILIFISALLLQNFVSYNKKLENAISFDALTGAYTRQAGALLLEHEIRKARHNDAKLTLCFIDMNNFKYINDTYGHRAGDILLRKAVEYMKKSLRTTDVIARFGGDEFVVILSDQNASCSNEDVIARLTAAMEKPTFSDGGHIIEFSASVGTAIFPDNGNNRFELVEYADKAMYDAKELRKKTAPP
ncbi:MAG: sensor domain-containing diguanylate cyclase, partial [Treponema sp.]